MTWAMRRRSATLVDDDAGKAVSVAVSFTDDAGSAESVTSAATAAVAAPPLTASFENAPSSHDGSSNFTFDLRFSEELRVGYRTLRDHAFTMDGGTVRNASRLEPGSNRGWRIEVRPNVNDDVTVVLPVTTDCNDDGAVKGGEKVYHCGGGIVYHRHDEKGLNWEPGGIRSGAGVRSSGVSQESTGSSDTWEAALCRLCLRR